MPPVALIYISYLQQQRNTIHIYSTLNHIIANLRATEDELKLEQRRKGSIAVTKDDLSFLGDNDNIMLSRSLVVNALKREFKEQITNCSAGDTAVAAGNNNNNENGQRRKSADEGRKGIMINPLQRTGRRRRQSMPTSSTTADVVDNSDKTTTSTTNNEIKAAQPTNTLSTAAAKYKPTSHRKGRRRGSGDSNNKNNNKGPKRKSLLDFHQTSNSSGSEDQSVDVPIANTSTHSDDDDDTPPWDNTQPQQSQSQPTTEEKKTFTPQAIQPKQRSSIWPRPLRKSIESSTSTFVEEDETNLDVSCWDERDKETLDISTYSLPLLDRTESTVGTRGSFDVLGLFTRRGSSSNRLSTSTKEGTTRSSLRTSQSSTEYDGIDESFQTAQQHHTQQQQQPERRPSRHCNSLQKSNRSFLSNVVFAASFEDVVSKGCTDILRNSLTKRLSISDRGREKNEDELRIRL